MEALEILAAVGVGFAAGVASGLLGVGGGVIFVPGLVLLLDESQLVAEATSLLAVVLVAAVGAWRQHHHENLRLREGVIAGALSPLGVAAGVVIANTVPQRALQVGFAVVQLYFAWHLARRALGRAETPEPVG